MYWVLEKFRVCGIKTPPTGKASTLNPAKSLTHIAVKPLKLVFPYGRLPTRQRLTRIAGKWVIRVFPQNGSPLPEKTLFPFFVSAVREIQSQKTGNFVPKNWYSYRCKMNVYVWNMINRIPVHRQIEISFNLACGVFLQCGLRALSLTFGQIQWANLRNQPGKPLASVLQLFL